MVVAVAELGTTAPVEIALHACSRTSRSTVGPAVVAAGRDGLLVAFLPSSPGPTDLLRRAFGRLSPGLATARLTVGVSGETAVDALTGALEEARFAHRVARAGGGPGSRW